MKKIFYILIGMLIMSGIVYAADALIPASSISYGDNSTVEAALNDLLGSGDATAANILADKQAFVNGELLTGTMPNNGAILEMIDGEETYTIPEGYHNGEGTVTCTAINPNPTYYEVYLNASSGHIYIRNLTTEASTLSTGSTYNNIIKDSYSNPTHTITFLVDCVLINGTEIEAGETQSFRYDSGKRIIFRVKDENNN